MALDGWDPENLLALVNLVIKVRMATANSIKRLITDCIGMTNTISSFFPSLDPGKNLRSISVTEFCCKIRFCACVNISLCVTSYTFFMPFLHHTAKIFKIILSHLSTSSLTLRHFVSLD